ncbi:MAG: hypothetical protein ACYCXW_15795 [Solirubrobacteraceae bacterium]
MNATRPSRSGATPRRAAGALAALAAMVLAGCAHVTTIRKDGTLRVALTEYRVIPQDVSTTAGVLTLVVHNYGRLTHDLVITLGNEPQISTGPIAPGQTSVLSAALIPGKYQMSSTILTDASLGAWGTLDVHP